MSSKISYFILATLNAHCIKVLHYQKLTIPETVISPLVDNGSKSVRSVCCSAKSRSSCVQLNSGSTFFHHSKLNVPIIIHWYFLPYISSLYASQNINRAHFSLKLPNQSQIATKKC